MVYRISGQGQVVLEVSGNENQIVYALNDLQALMIEGLWTGYNLTKNRKYYQCQE